MTTSQRTRVLLVLSLCGLGLCLPQASFAVTGCTNAYLTGTYNAQVSSVNLLNVLNALNNTGMPSGGTSTTSGGSTGSTSSTGSSGFFGPGAPSVAPPAGGASGGTTGSITNPGFANNPFSLNGALPGTSRFFFDGSGSIVGQNPNVPNANMNAGTYSVNSDCTASIKLVSGQNFNAVVVNGGTKVLFLESDAGSGGVVGSLERSTNVCLSNEAFPASFGFSFFGAQQVSSPASGSGSGGTTAAAAMTVAPFAVIGAIQLNSDNNFILHEWVYQNGKVMTTTNVGSFSVAADCGLNLKFASNSGGTTGAVGGSVTAPLMFRGALVNSESGLLVVQPDALTTITGQFIAQ